MTAPDDDVTNLVPEPAGSPVFVDASGRRARRIERFAALVVLACMGYGLALLIAAVTGVPIQGAIVPYPALGTSPHTSHPAPSPTPPPSGVNGAVLSNSTPSATPPPNATNPVPGSGATPTPAPTASATRTVHPTGRPTATPTHGKTSSAPGITHRPTARPTVANTHSSAVHP